jgi:hypothetical protein
MTKDPENTDGVEPEGTYTETEGEKPKRVPVHGEYTESAENPEPEPEDVEGHYTETDTDPNAHDRDEEHGHYTDADE